MKTILIQVIDSEDSGVRENEVLVSRIVGWYTKGRHYSDQNWTTFQGITTIISIDSGVEYEIAESRDSFRQRLGEIIDRPAYGFTGFTPQPPFKMGI